MKIRQLIVGLLVVLGLLGSTGAETTTAPADPLTAKEEEQAVRVATQYAQGRDLLPTADEGFALVGVELVNSKTSTDVPATPEGTRRQASVLFFRYDQNSGLRVLVDLRDAKALESATVGGQSVPVGRTEIERAARLALANDEVKRVLGAPAETFRVGPRRADDENTVEGLRVLGDSPKDPCTKNRCVDLFFRRGATYVAGTRVTVDLTTRAVRVTHTKP